jgi:hypothetical protein
MLAYPFLSLSSHGVLIFEGYGHFHGVWRQYQHHWVSHQLIAAH